LIMEAANSYISTEIAVMVLANPTYPVTCRYLKGSRLATAHDLMEASTKKANILIAILRERSSLQDCEQISRYFESNEKSFKLRKEVCRATFGSSTRSKVWSRVL
jgi:hypothetical protein